MLLFCRKGVCYMDKNLVHENRAFNYPEHNVPFYVECVYREIHKNGPPPIYHFHDKIELLYCHKGELEVTIFSKTIILKKGDLMFIAPNSPHATIAHSEYNGHYYVKFLKSILHVPTSRKIPSEEYFISLLKDYEIFHCCDEDAKYVHNLFESIRKNFSHDNYFKRLILVANIMQIMSYVFEHSASVSTQEPTSNTSNAFSNILEYIEENCTTITLEEAAKHCAMSYSYFSRNFKSEFGFSFSNFIIKKRIDKSLELLSKSDRDLNDIALECGFSSLSHYIKCFKESKGITPKKFRNITSMQ